MLSIRVFCSELVGTFVLVFFGVCAIALLLGDPQIVDVVPWLWNRLALVLLAFGLAIAMVGYSPIGRISGAHINPAISLAFAVGKLTRWAELPFYLFGQLCGAVLGAMAGKLLFPVGTAATKVGMTLPGDGYSLLTVAGVEFFGTAILMYIVAACSQTPSRKHLTGLVAGAWVWLFGTAIAQISGAGFNPARSLGPALVAGNYDYQWLYVVVPILGALVGLLLWRANSQTKKQAAA